MKSRTAFALPVPARPYLAPSRPRRQGKLRVYSPRGKSGHAAGRAGAEAGGRTAKRAGVVARVTPYSLRCPFATPALPAAVPDVSVSRRTRHAGTDFTKDVYVKVLPEMRRRLSGGFERLLSEATGNRMAHPEAPGVR
jgi:hypothetical protein